MARLPLAVGQRAPLFPLQDTRLVIREAAEYYTHSTVNQSLCLKPTSPSSAMPTSNASLGHPGLFNSLGHNFIPLDDEQDIWSDASAQGSQECDKAIVGAISASGNHGLACDLPDTVQRPRTLTASPSVINFQDLLDDELLQTLLRNETFAKSFNRSCNYHLKQHEQSLERAYNQRLSELEQYTREWRDSTKELWLAVKEGNFPAATKRQQEFLAWSGPQQMADELGPVSLRIPMKTMVAQASTQLQELPKIPTSMPALMKRHSPNDEGMSGHPMRLPTPGLPDHDASHLSQAAGCRSSEAIQEPLQSHIPVVAMQHSPLHGSRWVDNAEGFIGPESGVGLSRGSFVLAHTVCLRNLGPDFQSYLKIPEARRMVVKVTDEEGLSTYRDINAIHSILGGLLDTDIIVDLTYANVALFGKALSYLKDRISKLWYLAKLPNAPFVDSEVRELCAFLSSQPTAKAVSMRKFLPVQPRLSSISKAEEYSNPEAWRLLIARPKHQAGHIEGAYYFDVGIERRTARLKTGKCLREPP